jgi:hypothetical protein
MINAAALRAMKRGLHPHQRIDVDVVTPAGTRVPGTLVGVGSKVSVRSRGALIEDIPASWIRQVWVEEVDREAGE